MQVQRLVRKVTSKTQVRSSSGSSMLTHSCTGAGTPAVAMARDPSPYNGPMARTVEELSIVTLTPEARQVVREALAQEPDPARLALWLKVRGVQHASFVYDLYFQSAADAGDDDAVADDGELAVVVPKSSIDRLR